MPDEIPPTPATNAVKTLARFLHDPCEDEDASREHIQAELRKAGINTPAVSKAVRERIEQARARQQLAAARAKREAWLARIAQLPTVAAAGAARVRERVKDLLEAQLGTAQATVHFRKFEEANDDDLQSLLDDLTLLDQIGGEDDAPKT